VALSAFDPVILVFEGDVFTVCPNQPAVRDGNSMSVARQIGQHRLWSSEWTFGVDEPSGRSEWREACGKCAAFDEMYPRAVGVQLAGSMRGDKFVLHQPPEQF